MAPGYGVCVHIVYRRIYIANFTIFKIATSWSYHLHLREKSRSFSFTELRDFLVGSAHVRSQATVHAFICSMHEGRGYRYTFQRARVASSPEVPKVTWWKIATFLGYHLHWLTSLETSRHFRKIALQLGIFLAMFWECLCVVARQLAPKCCDFSNVAKLARQCKWPLWASCDFLYGPSGASRGKSIQWLRGDCPEIMQSQWSCRAASAASRW